jgi:hypothetical protein
LNKRATYLPITSHKATHFHKLMSGQFEALRYNRVYKTKAHFLCLSLILLHACALLYCCYQQVMPILRQLISTHKTTSPSYSVCTYVSSSSFLSLSSDNMHTDTMICTSYHDSSYRCRHESLHKFQPISIQASIISNNWHQLIEHVSPQPKFSNICYATYTVGPNILT